MWWQRKTNQLAIIYISASSAIVAGVLLTEKINYIYFPLLIIIYWCYRQKIYWLTIGLVFMSVCFWLGAGGWPNMGPDTVFSNYGYGKYVGTVIDEATIKIDKTVLVVDVNKVTKSKTEQAVTGKIQVETIRFVEFKPGDQVEVGCKVQPAKNIDGSWQTWLLKDGIIAKCNQAQVKKIGESEDLKYYLFNKLLWCKKQATSATKKILPEPYASLLGGILWGARAGLPDSLQQIMKSAGITHIIAISGYNISLITVALGEWLVLIGLTKKQMALVVSLVLFGFVIITGASASVVRAAVMGGVIVFVKLVQRKARAIVILPFALLLMGLFKPLALLYDAGLHLSFLATIGLMYINPLFEKKLPAKTPTWVKETCSTTFSATLMTGPYCWWQFGQLTLAGLISNLVVVPLVPLVMITGSIAVSVYFVLPILAEPWSIVTQIILALIIWTAQLTGKIPSI